MHSKWHITEEPNFGQRFLGYDRNVTFSVKNLLFRLRDTFDVNMSCSTFSINGVTLIYSVLQMAIWRFSSIRPILFQKRVRYAESKKEKVLFAPFWAYNQAILRIARSESFSMSELESADYDSIYVCVVWENSVVSLVCSCIFGSGSNFMYDAKSHQFLSS